MQEGAIDVDPPLNPGLRVKGVGCLSPHLVEPAAVLLVPASFFHSRKIPGGFEIAPSTPQGVGNGLLFYPGKTASDAILDSVRVQIIRDGIEDYQYWFELKKRWTSTGDAEARALLDEIANIKPRYVRFGPTIALSPEELFALRSRIARCLAAPAGRCDEVRESATVSRRVVPGAAAK